MLPFQTVFDVAQGGYRAWWLPLLILGIAAAAMFVRGHAARHAALLLTVLALLALGLTFRGYARLRDAMRRGAAEVVEGMVTGFSPGGLWRNKRESFSVAGVRFVYSFYDLRGGFRDVAGIGGPVRDGVYVRVWHVGETIVRMDIADSDSGSLKATRP